MVTSLNIFNCNKALDDRQSTDHQIHLLIIGCSEPVISPVIVQSFSRVDLNNNKLKQLAFLPFNEATKSILNCVMDFFIWLIDI